ncbi:MAG: type VI secretion system tube protein Hcp [bacterium]
MEIESFSWGLSQAGSDSKGGAAGSGTGKVSFQDLHFVMKTPEGYPRLANLAATGDKLEHVLIQTYQDAAVGVNVAYCVDKATVTSVQANIGSSGQDGVSVDLAYKKLAVATELEAGGLAVASFDLSKQQFSFGGSPPCP